MRTLGLDVGTKTIGVAVSDELGFSAQGVKVIRRTSAAADMTHIADLSNSYQCGRIVVGLPRNMNGTYGPAAQSVRGFIEALSRVVSVPIEEWDERLTTVIAQRALVEGDVRREKRRQVVDQVAAAVILQGYLDSRPRVGPN